MLFALLVPFAGIAMAEHGAEEVANVELEPDEDSAAVGTCNPFVVTAEDDDGDEAENEVIDVQASQEFEEGEDEPNLRFCDPYDQNDGETEGQEPAGEGGTTRTEDVNCPTAEGTNEDCEVIHGEFVTDENGQVLFGIMSDEEGETTVTAFHEPDCGEGNTGEDANEAGAETVDPDPMTEGEEGEFIQAEDRDDEDDCNDEPDDGEPQDTSMKLWTSGEATAIDCDPESATNQLNEGETSHEFECTLTNEEGDPVGNESDVFFEVTEGPNSEGDGENEDGVFAYCTTTATGEEDFDEWEIGAAQDDNEDIDTQETGEAYCYYEEDDDGESGESGTDTIVACFDEDGDEECESDEPTDEITKTWVADARRVDCGPETATNESGTEHSITCTVTDAFGQPVEDWYLEAYIQEGSVGRFTQQTVFNECDDWYNDEICDFTNQNGQVTMQIETAQNETGTTTVNVAIADFDDDGDGTPDNDGDTNDECDAAAGEDVEGDPQEGAAQGQCTDTVTKTWVTDIPGPAACEDGIDNDQDGMIDFTPPAGQTADPGCTSPQDQTEAPNPTQPPTVTRHDRSAKVNGFEHVSVPTKKRPRLEVKATVRHDDAHNFAGCQADVPVNIQIRAEGRWITRKTASTNNRGVVKVLIEDIPAKYRAKAPRIEVQDQSANRVDVCRRAVSPAKKHGGRNHR